MTKKKMSTKDIYPNWRTKCVYAHHSAPSTVVLGIETRLKDFISIEFKWTNGVWGEANAVVEKK